MSSANLLTLPAELRVLPFVGWKKTVANGKEPFVLGTNQNAKVNDAASWSTLDAVLAANPVMNSEEGVGIVMAEKAVEQKLVGIDLDGCRDRKTGNLTPWAEEIIAATNDSFTHITPSGDGVRIFVKGELPSNKHAFDLDLACGFGDKVKIEVYAQSRYFTVTTDYLFDDAPIENCDLAKLYEVVRNVQKRFPAPSKNKKKNSGGIESSTQIESTGTAITSKYELFMSGSLTGDKPCTISDDQGNSITYADRSAADQAFCNEAALKHNCDADAIWTDYAASCLARDKWLKREADFRRLTIAKAVEWAKTARASVTAPGETPSAVLSFPYTDMGNAERLVAAYGDRIRYCDETGRWFVWNNKLWEPAGKTGPLAMMQRVARSIREEAEKIKPESESDEDVLKAAKLSKLAFAWARKSESNSAVQAAISQARANSKIRVSMSQFDGDSFLLNLANGTLNLKTYEFRDHRREDLMTKHSPVVFDPSADCPKWLAFLDTSIPDAETRRFLQQAAGYSLTGATVEDCLFLNHGGGRNGKGVFLNTLKFILGTYGMQANFDSFTAGKGSGIQVRTDIARLAGARMVVASENDQDKRLAEGLLKTLTGSDTITARRLYEEEKEYLPQFKLWFAVNHKPRIIGVDEAIWNRIHLIPWTVYIPPEKRDKTLRETIIEKEAPGVLNWMLHGLRDYQKNGLVRSKLIIAATEEFRSENDQLQRFLDERTDSDEKFTVASSHLYAAYKGWAEATNEFAVRDRDFRRLVEIKGYDQKRSKKAIYWVGLRLKSDSSIPIGGVIESTSKGDSHEINF